MTAAEGGANLPLSNDPLQLRALADALPILISYVGVEGGEYRYRFLNSVYETWFSRPREELEGELIRDVIGPEAFAAVEERLARARAGETMTFEQLMPYKDGPQRHVQVRYMPRADANGTTVGIYTLVQDITDSKRAERRQVFLLKIEEALRRAPTAQAAVETACEIVGRELQADIAGVGLIDVSREEAEIWSEWRAGDSPSVLGRYTFDQLGRERLAPAFRGEPVIVNDAATDPNVIGKPEVRAAYAAGNIEASIDVPLIRDGRLRALFFVSALSARLWSSDEVDLVREALERAWQSVERARAEADLARSEALARQQADELAAVFDAAPVGICVLDRELRYVRVNERLAEMNGISAAMHVGRSVTDVIPELGAQALETLGQVLEGQPVWGIELVGATPALPDAVRTWRENWLPFRDAAGEIVGITISVEEITREKEAETRLRENEARLKLVQAAGGIGSFDYDLRRDRAVCSSEYYAIVGLPNGSVIDRATWNTVIHPEDRERMTASFRDTIANRVPFAEEYRIVRQDTGETRWLNARAAIVVDEADVPWRYVGGVSDVTQRKQVEERLRQLNDTLEEQVAERTADRDRMWRLSTDMMLVAELDATISATNPAWTRLLGWREQDLIGANFLDFVHDDDRAATVAEMERLGAGQTTFRFENRYRTSEEGWRVISWIAVPEQDRVHAVGRDVTEEKQRQAELEAAQDALRQSQKMEAVGQLVAGLAHDFNNLLGAVVGSLDLIRHRAEEPERVRRYAAAGLQAADRGAKLTAQLLAFSRTQHMDLRALVVCDLVEDLRELLSRTAGPLVELRHAFSAVRVPVLADATQLETAVLNLVINARDAMPEGGSITIGTAVRSILADPELTPGNYVELSVTDTGAGMDGVTLRRALDPFFTTKPVGQGTGLGLAQVYGIARQGGGTVRIESEVGVGTTVRVFLRAAAGQIEQDGPVTQPSAASPRPRASVLVIDDDGDVRQVLTEMLDALGHRATEAASGDEGLALLDEARPDLLIVDFAMPGMNGAEVARHARSRRSELPIMFASGFSDSAAITNVMGEDAVILRKPFRMDELRDLLAKMLD